jgi:Mg-chelatase subunit ChlD
MTRTTPKRRPLPMLTSLLTLVFLALLLAPAASAADLDLVFLIDTTGSMEGEIREAKETVRDVADALRKSRQGNLVRMGVVAFRDRGDDYVTRVSPLDPDVETSYAFLSSLTADGGGDGPEDVLAGLASAIRKLEWRAGPSVERLIFLIGDAPAHLDYSGPRPEELIEDARRLHIVINTIGCRSLPEDGIAFFRALSYATEGRYQHIGSLRTEESMDLGEALLQAVLPDRRDEDARGTEVRTRLDRSSASPTSAGVLVRLLTAREMQGESKPVATETLGETASSSPPRGRTPGASGTACFLEVSLADGLRLESGPLLTLRGGRLDVALDIAAPDGAGPVSSVFALDPCLPVDTTVRVSLGGRS